MIVWAAVGRRCARRGVAAVLHFGDWGAALCGPAWVRRPPASGLRARQTGRVAGISQRVRLGVVGAAAATVLAQAVSAVMCLLYAFRKYPELHLSGQDFHAEVCVYAQHLGQGLPMGLQFSALAIGIIVMQRALVGFDIG